LKGRGEKGWGKEHGKLNQVRAKGNGEDMVQSGICRRHKSKKQKTRKTRANG